MMNEAGMNDSTNPANNGADEFQAPVSPGARLAAYRQERGWTVEQVASQLNLAPRQVVAIESDDYAALPGMAVTRGFMRSYAKLLKVDAAPLLAAIGGEAVLVHESSVSSRKTLSTPFSEARIPSMVERPGISSKWLIGGLVVLLIAAGIWAAQQNGALESVSKSATSQVKEGMAHLSSSAPVAAPDTPAAKSEQAATGASASAVEGQTGAAPADKAASVASSGGATESSALAQASTLSSASVQAAAPTMGLSPAASASTASAPAHGENAPAAAKDPLVLTAKADSWIEVKRTSGNIILISRILKAGETETVDVTEPVSVVIGNSSGVQATLRGAPLEIKSAGGNVARLTVK
jgi:cytoskeleton protein RodZ